MNFFKSVFSDDPHPSQSESESLGNEPKNEDRNDPDRDSSPVDRRSNVSPGSGYSGSAGGRWDFGGLIKTLSSKSESIIETYRRDLQEFGTGLKTEIEIAQGSFQTVGHAFDEFGNTVVKGTAQIISQGKDAILGANLESDSDSSNKSHNYSTPKSLNSKRYSRFDAQVSNIQNDASTYCEEPEDLDDYNKWKSEFPLAGKSDEIESFLREYEAIESIYKRVVPNNVDNETFWYRYYYKVYKLKKAEDVRAKIVKRISREEEEQLTWDFEDDDSDDDDKEEDDGKVKADLVTNKEVASEYLGKRADAETQNGSSATSIEVGSKRSNVENASNLGQETKVESKDNVLQSKELGNKNGTSEVESQVESSQPVNERGQKSDDVNSGSKETVKEASDKALNREGDNTVEKNDSVAESNEKVIMDKKADDVKSSNRDNAASHHSSPGEEDLGWDEIEDLSSIEEKKPTQCGSPNKIDLRKRLSAAEEEEDLSWDNEDDDEPVKA
ncbi:hypothetical protein L6164_010137 [Bauhinia variegata]|uniref:Uncharacterized protein n=1 Tax=Bauhinia variegata TaxID=167791 RepID=A0ACB9PPR7_BAUVA|nr:hypothetical protein L6164_010137 [Bauhinia variegata]